MFIRLAVAAVALMAGAAVSTAPARAADAVHVGYAAQAFVFTGPVQMGLDQGFFARRGLNVTPVQFSGGAKLHQAMVSGALDVGMGSSSDFAFLVKGAPEVAIYAVMNEPHNVGISAINPAIQRPDDLKGRRIGVTTIGSYTYWLASGLPRFLHWDSGTVMPVAVGGTIASEMAALTTGQVDAIVSDIALGLTLAEQGRGRVVLSASDIVKNGLVSLVFAQADLVKTHPDILRRYNEAIQESLDYIVAHDEEAAQLAAREGGFPLSVVRREIEIIRPGWSRDGRITERQLASTAQEIVQAGLLQELPDLMRYHVDIAH